MKLFSFNINTAITDIQWEAYPISFLLFSLCLFTIAGNAFILYIIIIRDSTLHTPKYYFIASLAFADLLVGLIIMPLGFLFEMTEDELNLFSEHLGFFCGFWHSMDIFSSTASIFCLSIIGIDRYIAITKPIEYPQTFIYKKWHLVLLFTWFCSAAISFPAIIHFGTQQIFSESIVTPSLIFKQCSFPKNRYYILFISIASFYLPLLVMIYVYIRVYSVAKKQVHALHVGYKCHYLDRSSFQLVTLRIHHGSYHNPCLDSSSNEKNIADQKAKTFVGLVMGVFVFCWSPYFIYFLLSGVFNIRLKNEENHELLFKIFSWLGYTNSALDVLVYIFTSVELRTIIWNFRQ